MTHWALGFWVVELILSFISLFIVLFTDVDDCVSARCANGAKCVDGVNQYNCVCQPGFTGELCDQGEKNNSPERGLGYSSIWAT